MGATEDVSGSKIMLIAHFWETVFFILLMFAVYISVRNIFRMWMKKVKTTKDL